MENWQELLLTKEALMVVVGLIFALFIVIVVRRFIKKIKAFFSPRISLVNVKLIVPKPDTQYGEVHFTLANRGRGKAKVSSLAIHIIASGQSTKTRDLLPPKKGREFIYRIELRSDRSTAEIRTIKAPNKAARPLLGKKEAASYVVQLTSDEYAWYRLKVIAQWHNVKQTKKPVSIQSKEMYIEFQPS